jgi:hypothetical protein
MYIVSNDLLPPEANVFGNCINANLKSYEQTWIQPWSIF